MLFSCLLIKIKNTCKNEKIFYVNNISMFLVELLPNL